jgi:hypothetical protein
MQKKCCHTGYENLNLQSATQLSTSLADSHYTLKLKKKKENDKKQYYTSRSRINSQTSSLLGAGMLNNAHIHVCVVGYSCMCVHGRECEREINRADFTFS